MQAQDYLSLDVLVYFSLGCETPCGAIIQTEHAAAGMFQSEGKEVLIFCIEQGAEM